MDVEDDQNAVQEARLITDRLSDGVIDQHEMLSIDDVDEEDTEVEGIDSEDEEDTSAIPYLKYIKVKCADCGYPYNPTARWARSARGADRLHGRFPSRTTSARASLLPPLGC